jgi:uncharacterized membrane protein (UPF0127 family)
VSRKALVLLVAATLVIVVVVVVPWGVPPSLWTSSRTTAWVGDQRLDVVRNPGNGMVGVDDLGSLEGMLFELPTVSQPTSGSGWQMLDVRIPLDIAFFDITRRLIEVQHMEPCDAEPCQVYEAHAPYLWVLETEAGVLHAATGSILRIEDRPAN